MLRANTMSRSNLVVVRTGDSSMHPLWLATGATRNWDLIVLYCGSDSERYPASADGMVRIDGQGPKWPALHRLLAGTGDAWQGYRYIWLPDDDLIATCADINRMFDLMSGLSLQLAMPSLSWDSRVEFPLTLHNSNFAVRYSNYTDPAAPAFCRALLERALAGMADPRPGAERGFAWPALLANAPRECAILDRVQVKRSGAGAVAGGPATPAAAARLDRLENCAAVAAPVSYGGLDRDGQLTTLFGERGEGYIYALCAGYLGLPAPHDAAISRLFSEHEAARSEFMRRGRARAAGATAAATGARPVNAPRPGALTI
jgi:hypothetical protein